MKNIIFFALSFMALMGCTQKEEKIYLFSYFVNNGNDGLHLAYSNDALSWTALNDNKSFLTPNVGQDKLMRDPCIIIGKDGKFHMVWTVSWEEKGIGYASSTDLVHWSEQKYIPVMENEPNAKNCWAPELFYDNKEDQYLIYWATTIPGKYPETDASGGNGRNHRIYYTTTKDFRSFSEAKILYDKGFNVIDATIQKINDEYIMFLKNETKIPIVEKNIRIAKSKNLYGDYSQPSEPVTGNWVEGPTVVKTDSVWIMYFDMYTNHKMGALLSANCEHWTNISDKISFPEGTRHGSVFKVQKSVLDKLKKEMSDQNNK